MKILLLGASGFIGQRVYQKLSAHHQVITPSHQQLDLLNLQQASVMPLLEDIDLIVNCVGVMSRHADILETIHHHAPKLLAQWAKQAGVSRWVQLSALGAEATHRVNFVGSKGRGDEAVCTSGLQTVLARPSVVYGRGGVSCEIFLKLAQLPILPLPAGGTFDFQPVHAEDVADGIIRLIENAPEHGTIIAMTGSQQLSLAQYLNVLRETIHRKSPAKIVAIPISLMRPMLPLTNIISNGFLSSDGITLLQQGSCANHAEFTQLLGREPLGAKQFFTVN